MNKIIIFSVIAVIIGGIFLLILTYFPAEDLKESTETQGESKIEEENQPQGRNLSIQLDEKMGLSAP